MTFRVRPDVVGLSPLATFEMPKQRDVVDRTIPVHGLVVHGTGSGIVKKALAAGADPLEFAVAYYLRPDSYFAHYVIGFDGTIAQIADEHERASHVGLPAADRAAYLGGSWRQRVPASFAARWSARWPGKKSPSHLYPGPSPNDAYVGAELLVWQAGCDGQPHAAGAKYTTAQHDAAAALAADVASRWGLPVGWQDSGRLVGHEDLSPLTRTNAGGGWDPGGVRAAPWFDWGYAKERVAAALDVG